MPAILPSGAVKFLCKFDNLWRLFATWNQSPPRLLPTPSHHSTRNPFLQEKYPFRMTKADKLISFLKIGSDYAFVMHALLAFSATHLAWLTDCPLTAQMAYEHRGVALKGLHEAISSFGRNNSDAVLAASLLLSWQATEWKPWTQLMHGTSSVIDAMQPWKHESQFTSFISEQSTFPTAPPSPAPGGKKLSNPRKQDLDSLQRAYTQLQRVEAHLKENNEDPKAIQQLMTFVRGVRKVSPRFVIFSLPQSRMFRALLTCQSHTAAQRFELLQPLRAWLFWLPVMFLQQTRGSPSALVILAHYYCVALVVEPLFPEVGAAYFGSLSVEPIEEIARRLFSISVGSDMQTPLNLMEYPIDMVSNFRARQGWIQPERTASFPTFSGNDYSMSDSYPSTVSFSPYGNPAFTYSQEHIMTMPPDLTPISATSASPLTLDPYSNNYLGIPSPSGFGGYHSPASSNFGEGSIIYSDQGDDFALYDGQGPGSNFGGFVAPPMTVWI